MGVPIHLGPFPNAIISEGMMEGSALALMTRGMWSIYGVQPSLFVDRMQFKLSIRRAVQTTGTISQSVKRELGVTRTSKRKLEG